MNNSDLAKYGIALCYFLVYSTVAGWDASIYMTLKSSMTREDSYRSEKYSFTACRFARNSLPLAARE